MQRIDGHHSYHRMAFYSRDFVAYCSSCEEKLEINLSANVIGDPPRLCAPDCKYNNKSLAHRNTLWRGGTWLGEW